MSYIHSETKAGKTVLIKKYQSSRYHKKGIRRGRNREETKESQKRGNTRREVERLMLLLNENFGYGDYHLTLTYAPAHKPDDMEAAGKDLGKFLRKLRKCCRGYGSELKYIAVTEYGKRGALHHHIVMNGVPGTREIQDIWGKGRCRFSPLDETGEYSRLAAYLLKKKAYWKELGGKGKYYRRSRNLVMPETVKKIIDTRDGYYEKPRPRKGYYIDGDSVQTGHTKEGWPYLSYILIRENGRRGP